jgi:hypothetical protein
MDFLTFQTGVVIGMLVMLIIILYSPMMDRKEKDK